jgi:hypothetical protein
MGKRSRLRPTADFLSWHNQNRFLGKSEFSRSRARCIVPLQKQKSRAEARSLQGPEEIELFPDVGEVPVAGGESGSAMDGEGGGETISVGEFVFDGKFGGSAGLPDKMRRDAKDAKDPPLQLQADMLTPMPNTNIA